MDGHIHHNSKGNHPELTRLLGTFPQIRERSAFAHAVDQFTAQATSAEPVISFPFLERALTITARLHSLLTKENRLPSFADVFPATVQDNQFAMLRTLDILIENTPQSERSHCFRLRQSFELPVFRTAEAFYQSFQLEANERTPSICLPLVATRALVTTDGQNLFWGNYKPTTGGMLNLFWNVPVSESEDNEIIIYAGIGNTEIHFRFKGEEATCRVQRKIFTYDSKQQTSGEEKVINFPERPISEAEANFLETQLHPLLSWAESTLDRAEALDSSK